MIRMKDDDLENRINAEIKTKIIVIINEARKMNYVVVSTASNISIWPPMVSIVQPNIPPALSENISSSGNENTASREH